MVYSEPPANINLLTSLTSNIFPGVVIIFGDLFLSGLTIGAIYALVGLSFVIILLATGFINFAQGDLLTVGGFLAYSLVQAGIPLPAVLIITFVTVSLLGFLTERMILRPIWTRQEQADIKVIMSTLAIALIVQNVALRIFGGNPYMIPPLVPGSIIDLGAIRLIPSNLGLLAVSIVAMTALALFFRFTMTGIAMRAATQDRETASLMGVRPSQIVSLSFAIGAGFAGLAGVMVGSIVFVRWDMGLLAIKAFAGAALGGLFSIPGAIIGCLLLGVLESFIGVYLMSGFRDVAIYVVFILVLLFRPQGLLGSRSASN